MKICIVVIIRNNNSYILSREVGMKKLQKLKYKIKQEDCNKSDLFTYFIRFDLPDIDKK